MLRYFLRRIYQCFFILIGVMLLTFVLFRLSAGDGALMLLGKNPTAQEVESMRYFLGSQKPMFFGFLCKTEAYHSANYQKKFVSVPDIVLDSNIEYEVGKGLLMPKNSCVELKNRFAFSGEICIKFLTSQGIEAKSVFPESGHVFFTARESLFLTGIEVEKKQKNPFNSQLFDTFKELVTFKASFPYVSFFNFGNSLTRQEPVCDILWRGIGPSLALMLPIFLGELFLGILLALVATAYKDTWLDFLIMLFAVMGMSISYLAFILFGQYILAYQWGLFPVWGFESMGYLLLPILIGILTGLGGGVRFYRTVFVNELHAPYLRTAKAKGASTFGIYFNHLLPNAMIPIISRVSVTLPFLFTGSLLLEKFFGIPGLGFAGISALAEADLQLLKAIVVFSTLLFLVVNLLTDLLYAYVDPRIRLK